MTAWVEGRHWRCSKCSGINSQEREKCLECDLPRPENPQYNAGKEGHFRQDSRFGCEPTG